MEGGAADEAALTAGVPAPVVLDGGAAGLLPVDAREPPGAVVEEAAGVVGAVVGPAWAAVAAGAVPAVVTVGVPAGVGPLCAAVGTAPSVDGVTLVLGPA